MNKTLKKFSITVTRYTLKEENELASFSTNAKKLYIFSL